ncbi:hypothetical protein GCM10020331_085190 [Ectobacillus funiculus]
MPKINVNTENIQAWAQAVREVLVADEKVYEPRAIITPAREAIVAAVKGKNKRV